MPSELRTSREGSTLILTLSDPATRNTLSPQVYAAGVEALNMAESDDAVRAVIVRGDGEHFCAGGDLNRIIGLRQTGPAAMPLILFEDDPDFRTGYAWTSEMVKRGVYVHPWHNMFMCTAMTEADIALAHQAADESFKAVKAKKASLEPHKLLLAMFEARH